MSTKQLSLDDAEAMWTKAKKLKDRRPRKAIKLATRLINEAPCTPDVLASVNCFIADIYNMELEEYDTAIGYYLEGLSHGGDWGACERLGLVYLRHKKDYESAASFFQHALDRGPGFASREFIVEELAEAKSALGR